MTALTHARSHSIAESRLPRFVRTMLTEYAPLGFRGRTEAIRNLFKAERATWRVLLAGLLIRLLLMPITAHSDLMHIYWGSHLIAYHQRLPGFQGLLRYLHAGYLWLITPLLPPVDTLWIHSAEDPFLNPFVGQVLSTQGWYDFISQTEVFRTLFLLKVPYLLFDLGCAILLYRLGSDRDRARRMFTLWWLNPILLFAVYVFGRHEVIALFFVILSLYWIQRDRQNWGFLALGVAIAIRYYPVFLLPFFVFSLQASWKKRMAGLAIGLAPWLGVNLLGWALVGTMEAEGLASLPHDAYLLALKFELAAWDNLYLFPLAYFLLLLHRLYNREYGFPSLVQYSLITLLLLFATAHIGQSPQYWTWFLPLLIVATAESRVLLPLHLAQIACLAVTSFLVGRSTAGYLFGPISPDFFWSLPSPAEVLSRWAAPEMVIGLARTAFSAISLWMAYLVFRQLRKSFSIDPEAEGAG